MYHVLIVIIISIHDMKHIHFSTVIRIMITFIQLRVVHRVIEWKWSVPEGEGDQRKKGAPCHEPGYEIHIHWPDESKCRICLYTKSKTSMAPVAKESATAKIGLERALNLRSPFVRFVDLLVY